MGKKDTASLHRGKVRRHKWHNPALLPSDLETRTLTHESIRHREPDGAGTAEGMASM
jgi:hypothetical protein